MRMTVVVMTPMMVVASVVVVTAPMLMPVTIVVTVVMVMAMAVTASMMMVPVSDLRHSVIDALRGWNGSCIGGQAGQAEDSPAQNETDNTHCLLLHWVIPA